MPNPKLEKLASLSLVRKKQSAGSGIFPGSTKKKKPPVAAMADANGGRKDKSDPHKYFDIIGNRYQTLRPVEDLRVFVSDEQMPFTKHTPTKSPKPTVSSIDTKRPQPGPFPSSHAPKPSRHFRIRSIHKGRNKKGKITGPGIANSQQNL